MAEQVGASDASLGGAPRLSRRDANAISWVPERGRAKPATPALDASEPPTLGGPSHRPGDVPASLGRRYFTEALRAGGGVAFFEGPGAKTAAFKDHGTHLATDRSHPAVVRDIAAIAAHRGWTTVRVSGEDEFRREMWLEARALGLDVKGYRPRERDQQELDRRLAGAKDRPDGTDRRAAVDLEPAKSPSPVDMDLATGLLGRLVDMGQASYRRRAGAPLTPFLRIDRGQGRMLDVWGAGLGDALQRSGARRGDMIRLRRDDVEVVRRPRTIRDRTSGEPSPSSQVAQRWTVEAERFNTASPREAALQSALQGAQSHLAVMNAVIDQAVKEPERRARLRAEARRLVAETLAQGRRLSLAKVREIEPPSARERTAKPVPERMPEQARRR